MKKLPSGLNFASRRRELKLSIKEVAKQMDCNYKTIERIEACKDARSDIMIRLSWLYWEEEDEFCIEDPIFLIKKRKKLELSVYEVAKQTGINTRCLYNFEKHRPINYSNFIKLTEFFDKL